MKKLFISLLIGTTLCLSAYGQKGKARKLPAWLVQPSIGYQFPGGDLANRFGENFAIGIGAGYKSKSDWIFSLDFQYMFSDNVKNVGDLLSPVLSDQGFVFNQIGNYADVAVLERGLCGTANVAKVLPFMNVNVNSGPTLQLGAGYLTHWVDITDVGNNSPQIMDEYDKGYDQLSGGPLLKESIGYLYLSRKRTVNFKISFEFMQALTQNLRGFDYSTGKAVDGWNLDLLYGMKLQWILPIYSEAGEDYFYD